MENFPISVNLMNAVLQYLGARPYQEVFQLIQAIQEAAKPKVKEESSE
jgi:hypothetical protein